eukprot:7380698-Prymnesium_polylepis.1
MHASFESDDSEMSECTLLPTLSCLRRHSGTRAPNGRRRGAFLLWLAAARRATARGCARFLELRHCYPTGVTAGRRSRTARHQPNRQKYSTGICMPLRSCCLTSRRATPGRSKVQGLSFKRVFTCFRITYWCSTGRAYLTWGTMSAARSAAPLETASGSRFHGARRSATAMASCHACWQWSLQSWTTWFTSWNGSRRSCAILRSRRGEGSFAWLS